ncbi:hypothetical protein GCM10023317_28180 [Actinopolymorpha pittospori]
MADGCGGRAVEVLRAVQKGDAEGDGGAKPSAERQAQPVVDGLPEGGPVGVLHIGRLHRMRQSSQVRQVVALDATVSGR